MMARIWIETILAFLGVGLLAFGGLLLAKTPRDGFFIGQVIQTARRITGGFLFILGLAGIAIGIAKELLGLGLSP